MIRDFSSVKTVVLKVGTNLLSTKDGIDESYIDTITGQIAALKKKDLDVLLVTSGAIGMGARELKLKGPVKKIEVRQACASIGQPILMSSYRRSFTQHGLICAQILLTRWDLDARKTYVNLRNSVENLLKLGVVPVFNENDTVSTAEIGSAFGDNDRMSAMVASKIDADLLIIMTDIPGLYTADPKKDSNATLVPELEHVDDTVLAMAGGAGSQYSTGGMKTKLLAAQIAAKGGCGSLIVSGYEENVLERVMAGEVLGTYIHPDLRISQRARWILNNSHAGTITVDKGAEKALRSHKSLLPSGMIGVTGVFHEGDVVNILDVTGKAFAKAVPYFDSTELIRLIGCRSEDIPKKLGGGKKEMVFRPDDLVFLDVEDR